MSDGEEYCDLVMKGGIASGIVYPNAVIALAKRYRFKSIGGTSAGAIAAAAAASAALGERRKELDPSFDKAGAEGVGFVGLQRVAEQLTRKGFIYSLFQPAPGGRAAFRLLVSLTSRSGPVAVSMAAVRAIVTIAPLEFILTFCALLGMGWAFAATDGLWAVLLPAMACAFAVALVAGVLRVARAIRRNRLGLCSGMRRGDRQTGLPALTEWLHDVLQRLAGQRERPLLFADLWTAPQYPQEPVTEKVLSLAVITTSVSHHEPRSLPFESSRFWFLREDFDALFPKSVVDWMADQDPSPLEVEGRTYYRLPERGQLPIIVAARMSLSFPILISAVPLYEASGWARTASPRAVAAVSEADQEDRLLESAEALATGGAEPSRTPQSIRICWFSDGGISSNFPIHLFDAALPRWPTFAIDLTYPKSNAEDDTPEIFLPTENNQGWQGRYEPIAAHGAFAEVAGFLFGIIATMQNWRDLLQSRAPGHRDRIVHIALKEDEGGMNLDMDQEVLSRIAAKGGAAGDTLVREFDFNNHWWVRWRNVASATERFTIELAEGAGPAISTSYVAARASAITGEPPAPSYPFTGEQQRDAQRRLAVMIEQGELWADTEPDLTYRAPRPLPQLRITPTF